MSAPNLSALLQLLGTILEVAGAFMMANQLMAVTRRRERPLVIASGLVRGKRARDAVSLEPLNRENRLATLQGLGLIAVGFLLQAVGNLVVLVMSWSA